MKLEDMRRELLRFRFDPQYKGPDRRVPALCFAEFVGLSRQTLYALMARSRMFDLTDGARARIAYGIIMVRERGLRWRRRGGHWQPFLPDGSLPVAPEKKRVETWSGGLTAA